jgi:5-methyltetrahydropteroyltriglutamate--homocysteine methyltransferase
MKQTSELFPVQEIGSIAKPNWRVRGYSGYPLAPSDIQDAEEWGKKLGVANYKDLISTLKDERDTPQRREKIREWSVLYALKLFEKAGVHRYYSGEQWRVEMYEHVVRRVKGFNVLGHVQSFDYKYYNKAAIRTKPARLQPIYLDEFKFVQWNTSQGVEIKVPITGPYTIVDWSFNELYERNRSLDHPDEHPRKRFFEARREFISDLVREVLRPEVIDLVNAGAKWIQIDEPAITTHPENEDMEIFVDAINELTSGIGCTFSLHNCYSDYNRLAIYAPKLKDISQLALEFANRDPLDLGVDERSRRAYKDIKKFVEEGYKGDFGVGVVHVHDYVGVAGNGAAVMGENVMETPKLVRDRILFATNMVGDEAKVSVNPDCGLRTRSWSVAFEKLRTISEGARLARGQEMLSAPQSLNIQNA